MPDNPSAIIIDTVFKHHHLSSQYLTQQSSTLLFLSPRLCCSAIGVKWGWILIHWANWIFGPFQGICSSETAPLYVYSLRGVQQGIVLGPPKMRVARALTKIHGDPNQSGAHFTVRGLEQKELLHGKVQQFVILMQNYECNLSFKTCELTEHCYKM